MSTARAFPASEAICRIKNPLDWSPEKGQLMADACRELALFHAERNPDIAALYKRHGFDPGSIRAECDLTRIPALGVSAMKSFLLTSLPHEQAVLKLTSSGTRGQKTQIWFDAESLDRVQAQLWMLWEQEGLLSDELTNYVMFVYDPEEAKDLGIAFSDKNQQRFAPPHRTAHTIKRNKQTGEWEFRMEDTIRVFHEYCAEGKPVRLFGIPSFIFEFLSELESRGLSFRLPPGSMMMSGGGWKAAEDKKVTREEFREKCSRLLGIPVERLRDGYGMAEHSAPYMECRKHRFHIPCYNRIFVRDPVTYEVLPDGEVGLIELVTPFNAMMPNLAILSTDLGYLHAEKCPCGWNSPTFGLVGRGGLVKHKGCAIHASEIIKRKKS